MRHNNPPKAV